MSANQVAAAAADEVLSGLVDQARGALDAICLPEEVGEHLGVKPEGERVVSHLFECLKPGYRGWHWEVTMARLSRGKTGTVSECNLLPGEGALLAPPWVPWKDRLQPGDLGADDILPYRVQDDNLEEGYEATGEDADEIAVYELGLGRARVLSAQGRARAAKRWYNSADSGPVTVRKRGRNAGAVCANCGYFLKMAGSFRQVFGVCANEWSPADGRVVALEHSCGAHSETDVVGQGEQWPIVPPRVDELDLEQLNPEELRATPDPAEKESAPAEKKAKAVKASAPEDKKEDKKEEPQA